jgi:glycosyltransferase 2 family protein
LSAPLKFAGKLRTRNSWSWIPFAISVTIVGFSIYALTNRVRDVDFDRVAAHVLAMPATQIGWAVLFIAGAYATLTCYDYFAVRTLGANHVPYRIAGLASFTSYSIGHNIGFTAFSGGAIRYRIYSQFGLGIIDVTKLCFLTGLTFWLGNLAVLGTGIAWRPEVASRIIDLPSGVMRAIGLTGLLLLGLYVAWASRRPRTIGIANWNVRLPSGRSTLIQIGIGLADLGCSSFAMYNLLPATVHGEPLTIMTAFVSATLLGFVSHAPGSLGVFEYFMLKGLPEVPTENLLAALLVFRLLYFVAPFCLALITMALWESVLFVRRNRGRDGVTVTTDLQISDHPPFTRHRRKQRPQAPRDH